MHPLLLELLNRTDRLERRIRRIEQTIGAIVTDQEHLDAEVADIVADTSAIQAEIEALKAAAAASQPLDFTALDSAVAALGQVAAPPASPAA